VRKINPLTGLKALLVAFVAGVGSYHLFLTRGGLSGPGVKR
jgi:hypothetical protein